MGEKEPKRDKVNIHRWIATAGTVINLAIVYFSHIAQQNFGFEYFWVWIITASAIVVTFIVGAILPAIFKKRTADIGPAYQLPIYNPSDRLKLTPEQIKTLQTNRRKYLNTLTKCLDKQKRSVIVVGVKGVGKSFLAAKVAKPEDFWIDFIGKTIGLPTLLIMGAQWLEDDNLEAACKDPKQEVGERQINLLCDLLQSREQRLFFDNLETLLDKKSRRFKDKGISLFFERLFTMSHECQIVITSRIKPCLADGREVSEFGDTIDLPGLSDNYGAQILKKGGIKNADAEKLKAISKEAGGNPLLLQILPALVNRPGGEKVLEDLKIRKKKYREEFVNAKLLEEAAQGGKKLICRLSIIPEPITLAGIKILCGNDLDGEHWANELVQRSLLEWNRDDDSFRLHPAIAETALEELRNKPRELRITRTNALKMYMAEAREKPEPDAWESLDDCRPLLRAAELMIELGDFEQAAKLINQNLIEPLNRWGHWSLLRDLYERLLALWERLPERPKKLLQHYGAVLGNYCVMLINLGDYQKAIEFHEKHLKVAQEIGDRRGEGAAYGNLGNAYFSLGDYPKAIEFHEKHLKVAEEIGDRRGEGAAYGNLGNAFHSQGDYQEAIEFHEKHLKVAQEIGDRRGEGAAYGNLGNAFHSQGDYQEAIEFHEKRLKIAREIGDRRGEGAAFGNLGNAFHSQGDYQRAIEFHEKHLKVALEIGDRRGEGAAFGNLGNAHYALGDYQMAIEFHDKALEIDKEIENKKGIGEDYGNLGIAYKNLADYQKAIEYYLKALEIAEAIGDASGMATSNYNVALLHKEVENWPKAAFHAVRGLLIAFQIRMPDIANDISLTIACRDALGAERFREIAVESVGEEGAAEVESLHGHGRGETDNPNPQDC